MGAAPFQAAYALRLRTDAEARALAESLRVEANDPLPRASVSVASTGTAVTISVRADDASSLRAASKSFLSWATGALRSLRAAAGR